MRCKHILLDPHYYEAYGSTIPSPFSVEELPISTTKHFNSSTFLREVYKTERRLISTTKLTLEQRIVKVNSFAEYYNVCIVHQLNDKFYLLRPKRCPYKKLIKSS